MTGNISSRPKAPFISGNKRASRMSPAGSAYSLTRAILLSSPTLYRRAVSQKAARPEDEDQNQDGKDDDVRPANADVLVRHRTDDADQDAADDCPSEIPYTAQNRRRERKEPLPEAEVEDGGAVEKPEHDARRPSEDTSQEEGHGDGAINVYPHHCRRLFILCDGTHCLALTGAPDEIRQAQQQRYRHKNDEEILPAVGDGVGKDREGVAVGDQERERYLRGALP